MGLLYPFWYAFWFVGYALTPRPVWGMRIAILSTVILSFLIGFLNPYPLLFMQRLIWSGVIYLIGYVGYRIALKQGRVLNSSEFLTNLGEFLTLSCSGFLYGLNAMYFPVLWHMIMHK